jgi:hypothetical protein
MTSPPSRPWEYIENISTKIYGVKLGAIGRGAKPCHVTATQSHTTTLGAMIYIANS